MMSSTPTSCHKVHCTIPKPDPASRFMARRFQQPPGSINKGNQAQGDQPPFITSPGIIAGSHRSQENTQTINPALGTVSTNFTEKAKKLGAIQIIIGLMHLSLGMILGTVCLPANIPSITFTGGYSFWGSFCFTVSGSFSVSAAKRSSPRVIRGSLGMNIVSCIFALTGVSLLVMDMYINVTLDQSNVMVILRNVILAVLFIISILEFCIACATAHFVRQSICNISRSVPVVPTVYANNPLPPELSSPPPRNEGYLYPE
uniref:Membrane spanning 4-domains A12 n=2 Tax=Otolemur garnettii TaxID=30611 RepID=H0XYN5_OTOGA